jgi:hypothetical protein
MSVMPEEQLYATDPNLERALEMVRSDHQEAEKFVADPEQYLRSKGINTEGLKFQGELADEDLEQVAGGNFEAQRAICGGVGGGICGSVGG